VVFVHHIFAHFGKQHIITDSVLRHIQIFSLCAMPFCRPLLYFSRIVTYTSSLLQKRIFETIALGQGWANYGPRVACGPLNIFCGARMHKAHFYNFFVLIEYIIDLSHAAYTV